KDNKNPQAWAKLIDTYKVTIWNSVPALMYMLVDYLQLNSQDCDAFKSHIRITLLSGDWIPLELPEKIRQILGSDIISLGGATEASIWSIFYNIGTIDPSWVSIPYGNPLSNQKFYIYDENLNHVPVGVKGELYIGGIGVAMGYLNDTDKTASSFIYHPKTNEYLYKTGDFGKFSSHGYIEFIGRKDSQIKINGYRIESGEIEHKLLSHPAIEQSIVIVDENKSIGQRLLAYIILNKKIELSDIYNYLHSKLPHYMVPEVIMEIKSIPLTTNGKIDRKSLPKPPVNSPDTFMPLVTNTERVLASIWRKLLDIVDISANSNFFHLGGQSLTAVRLVAMIRNKLHIQLSVKSIFEHSSLREMAHLIDILSLQINHQPESASVTVVTGFI
ncbi:MAG: non-ribosomal peptide synthetase, partial [Gammaproteobacteria bacterium]